MAPSREMAVLGQLLDKFWTHPDLFKFQIYCKNNTNSIFNDARFASIFSLFLVPFLHLLDSCKQLLGKSWAAFRWFGVARGGLWQLLGCSWRGPGGWVDPRISAVAAQEIQR